MKTATTKNKQNTLTSFFTKIPRDLPLSECSNTLESIKKIDDLTASEVINSHSSKKYSNGVQNNLNNVNKLDHKVEKKIIDLVSPQKSLKNVSVHKRKPESDENKYLKKNKLDTLNCSPKKLVKQKIIDDFNFNDLEDEFFQDVPEFENKITSDLNLTKLERYRVETITVTRSNNIRLTVQNMMFYNKGYCLVKSPWNACAISSGDIVSIKGRWSKTEDYPCWVVDWDGGILVTNSDHLLSSTTVVNSLYCPRKTVLSHMFREQDCSSKGCTVMLIGCIVHQLLQESLSSNKTTYEEIEELFNKIKNNKDFITKLFLENYKFDDIVEEIAHFIPKIYNFMCKYVNYEVPKGQGFMRRCNSDKLNGDWAGEIIGVRDIEENIWSHKLGIKGKVDATVQVKIHNRIKTVPLELKTGKVSPLNLEHRGQVILYCMMLQEMGENVDSGLLLYLRDEGQMIDVKFAEKEKRDLILLRNGLSDWLRNLSLVEPESNIPPPKLPKVINRNSCQTCPQLIACSSALRISGEMNSLEENHINKSLAVESTQHLTDEHINYVFHWLGLLSLEFQMTKFSVSRIWSFKPEEREAKGWCLSQMKVSTSSPTKGNRWEIVFIKQDYSSIISSIDVGQTVVVGNDSNVAVAMGSVIDITKTSITLVLDKDVKNCAPPMCIDIYESSSINVILMNNLGILLHNSKQADFLRKLIIETKVPSFAPKLSSKIKIIGQDIFERLNSEQVRAILQAMAADKYILIKGLPGAGKTTTMRAFIELLTRMGKRVLVTSFTHSAIDNILLGLPLLKTGSVLRIGPLRRIHPLVASYAAEDKLREDLGQNLTIELLDKAFSQKKVVGVTCLGCGHPWLERQKFDICLVDEATQVTQPAILKPISLAEKFILVGDPKQLPPLVLCCKAKENGMAVSLFEKLDRPAVTSQLTLQYRMNRYITNIANGFAYDGQLKCGNDQVAHNILNYELKENNAWPKWLHSVLDKVLEKSVIVVDVENTNPSNIENFDNKAEANLILKITAALQEININLETIGVIAAYRDQVNLLRDTLDSKIEVNTVDQYQGRDKEIIMFSTSRSSKNNASNNVLGDFNRLTVAITRAKKKLIIIGSLKVLQNYTNFLKLFALIPPSNIIKYS